MTGSMKLLYLHSPKHKDTCLLKKKSTLTISWKLYPQLFYDDKVRCQFKNVHFSLNSFKSFTYKKTCNHRIEILEQNMKSEAERIK